MTIWSVVVAFNPEPETLRALCRALRAAGSRVVVVDNTESGAPGASIARAEGADGLPLGRNTGIARALNLGIAYALACGADAVALFDQDSRPAPDLLPTLLAALAPGRPGVVAPVAVGPDDAEYPTHRLTRGGGARDVYAHGALAPVPVDLVITSGTVATAAAIAAAGSMDEDLFIDFVDVEWCLRLRARGVPVHVVPAATMTHRIGERTASVAGVRTLLHSEARAYYKLRNPWLLLRKPHVPAAFALRQAVIAVAHHLLQFAVVPDKRYHARTLLVALAHGVRGVTGVRLGARRAGEAPATYLPERT